MSFDLAAYLERTGLDGVSNDAAGLRALQQAQLRAIPFENFDPLLGRVPGLSLEEIFAKAVSGGRGGYCFELNILFEAALKAAGFVPRRLLARVRMRAGPEAARSHLALRVMADGEEWLADCGFGGPGPLHPLRLGMAGEQATPGGVFRVAGDSTRGETVLERLGPDGWIQLYAFDEARVTGPEIAAANHVCATWDQAPFGSHLMAGAWRGDARFGLFDRQLSLSGPEGASQRELATLEEFIAVVTGDLGIALPRPLLERAWERIDAAARPA